VTNIVYNGILCWLIPTDLDASFIIFHDIESDFLFIEHKIVESTDVKVDDIKSIGILVRD
jgi:hypothetical protein